MISGQQELPLDSDAPMSLSEAPDPVTESVLYPSLSEYSAALDSGISGERNPESSGEKERRPTTPTQTENESVQAMEMSEQEDGQSRAPTTPPPQVSPASVVNGLSTSASTGDKVILTTTMPTPKEQVSMDKILLKMCEVMRNIPQRTKGSGFIYAFFHPTNGSVFYKIGQTQDPQFREKTHRHGCELKPWKLHQLPQGPIQEYLRVEMLALKQLCNNGCDFKCHCTKQHKEYFIGNKKDGLNTLRLWIDWLEREKPFDDNRLLTPFWDDRVNAVDIKAGNARLRHLFQCHKTECVGRDPTRRGACQACLDAGWMRWTNPTAWEKFGYYFDLVQNTIGRRLILCIILYCLPGPFYGGLGLVQCLSFGVPTYLMHLGSRDNSECQKKRPKIADSSPGSQQSPVTPVKSSPGGLSSSSQPPRRLSFGASHVEETAPPTQEMTQVTPQGTDYLSANSPLATPSPTLRLRKGSKGSKRLNPQDGAVSASILPDTEGSSYLSPDTQKMARRRRVSVS